LFENVRLPKKVSFHLINKKKREENFLDARHAAFKYNCKFVETSAAINDKVDDLLAGTLKQIRINEQIRNEQKRRLTITNGSIDTNDSEAPILSDTSRRKGSTVDNRNSKNVFSKFLNVFRKKPTRLPTDVENLNTGI
jgi:Rad/Gem-related GTP binding protein 1